MHSHHIIAAAILAVVSPVFGQTSPAPDKNAGETKQEHPLRRLDRPKAETESVTFLGVETGSVSDTMVAQLNLPDGAGLVVLHVVPESAAAGALKEHDILLRLDDQILIDQHQLAVLVRNHKEGDEVTLTFVRGGKQQTAKVRLTKHDVPKFDARLHGVGPLALPKIELGMRDGEEGNDREDVDRTLSLMARAPGNLPLKMRIDRGSGPSVRAVRINEGNSNLAYSDEQGSLELTMKDGAKTLVAKDRSGRLVFSGPVTTPAQRIAMPADVRERLEKLESMQNVSFQTDEDFEGADTKVLPFPRKQIRFERRVQDSDPEPGEL